MTLKSSVRQGGRNVDAIVSDITNLESRISEFKKGSVDEALEIYKHILPKQQYEEVAKVYKSGVEQLDESIMIETESFVNKLRDLTMGSAPTDMLTVIGALGTLGYQLGKSDNGDQRTSIALKYGIPAIAGIGVSFYSNAKLYAGSKGLIIGSISSLLLNRIGIFADELLKKYKHESEPKAA